jgi:hypothetical protein
VYLRHSGFSRQPGRSEDNQFVSESRGGPTIRVIEYLWDFSFSRYRIPEAIEQKGFHPIVGGKFCDCLDLVDTGHPQRE